MPQKAPSERAPSKSFEFYSNWGREFKGTTKKLCDKDFAERSGELSGAICLKPLVLYWINAGNPLELFRKFFGVFRCECLVLWVLFGPSLQAKPATGNC